MYFLNKIERNSIILHLESTDKESAIHELLTRAPVFSKVRDLPALEKAILSREKVMSTGLGRGVAISHGEVPEIHKVVIALGLSQKVGPMRSWPARCFYSLYWSSGPLLSGRSDWHRNT